MANEELKELEQILNLRYAQYLSNRFFEISSNVDGIGLVQVKVLLQNTEQSFYYPIEARLDSKDQNISPEQATLVMIDYIDYYFAEYFKEDENVLIPIDWSEFALDGVKFQMRGEIRNLRYELAADEILARGGV